MAEKARSQEPKTADLKRDVEVAQSPVAMAELHQRSLRHARQVLTERKNRTSPDDYQAHVADILTQILSFDSVADNMLWRELFGLDYSFFPNERRFASSRQVDLGHKVGINVIFDDSLADLIPPELVEAAINKQLTPETGYEKATLLLSASGRMNTIAFEKGIPDSEQPILMPDQVLNRLNYGLISWLMENYQMSLAPVMGDYIAPSIIALAEVYGFFDGYDLETTRRRMLAQISSYDSTHRFKDSFLPYDRELFLPPDSLQLRVLKKLPTKFATKFLPAVKKAEETTLTGSEKLYTTATRSDDDMATYTSLKANDQTNYNLTQAEAFKQRAAVRKDLDFLYRQYASVDLGKALAVVKDRLPKLLLRVARQLPQLEAQEARTERPQYYPLISLSYTFQFIFDGTPLHTVFDRVHRSDGIEGLTLITETIKLISLDSNIRPEYKPTITRLCAFVESETALLQKAHDGGSYEPRPWQSADEVIKWDEYEARTEQAKERLANMDETSPIISTEDVLVAATLEKTLTAWKSLMKLMSEKTLLDQQTFYRNSSSTTHANFEAAFVFEKLVVPPMLGALTVLLMKHPELLPLGIVFGGFLATLTLYINLNQQAWTRKDNVTTQLSPNLHKTQLSVLNPSLSEEVAELYRLVRQAEKQSKKLFSMEAIAAMMMLFFVTFGVIDYAAEQTSLTIGGLIGGNRGGSEYASDMVPSDSETIGLNVLSTEFRYTGTQTLDYAGGPKCWPGQGLQALACSNKDTYRQFDFEPAQIEGFTNLADFQQAVEAIDTTKYAVQLKLASPNFYEVIDQTRPVQLLVENPSPDLKVEWHPLTGVYISGTFTRAALVSEVLATPNQLADPPDEISRGFFGAITPAEEAAYPSLSRLDGLRDLVTQELETQQESIAGLTPKAVQLALQQPAADRGWLSNREILLSVLGGLNNMGYTYGRSNFSGQPRPYAQLLSDQLHQDNWECEMFATAEMLVTRWAQLDQYLGLTTYVRLGYVIEAGASPKWVGDEGHAAVDYTEVDGKWYSFTPDALTGGALESPPATAANTENYFEAAEREGDAVHVITLELERHTALIASLGSGAIGLALALNKLRKVKINLPRPTVSFSRRRRSDTASGSNQSQTELASSWNLEKDEEFAADDGSQPIPAEVAEIEDQPSAEAQTLSSDELTESTRPSLAELTQALTNVNYVVLSRVFETLLYVFEFQGNYEAHHLLRTGQITEEDQAHQFATNLIRLLRSSGSTDSNPNEVPGGFFRQDKLKQVIRRQLVNEPTSMSVDLPPGEMAAAFNSDPEKVAVLIEGREEAVVQGLMIIRDRLLDELDNLELHDQSQTISFADAVSNQHDLETQTQKFKQALQVIEYFLSG